MLVATTIIENGLDIPRANTLIVNRADRYGLAQLYQLRGRVGRSDRAAYAYLLVPPEAVLSEIARKRLAAIQEFSELGAGFRIAALDLELRGAGNLLGGEQSGHIHAVGLDLYVKLLEQTILELQRPGGARSAPRDAEPAAWTCACRRTTCPRCTSGSRCTSAPARRAAWTRPQRCAPSSATATGRRRRGRGAPPFAACALRAEALGVRAGRPVGGRAAPALRARDARRPGAGHGLARAAAAPRCRRRGVLRAPGAPPGEAPLPALSALLDGPGARAPGA